MPSPRELLDAIHALPLAGRVRLLNLSGQHERMCEYGGIRDAMPERVELIAGPGCSASICPAADVFQAIQLASRQQVILLVEKALLRLPVGSGTPGEQSLMAASEAGANIRVVSAPIEAVAAAREDPEREMVLFCTGFETLFAPLAGLIVEGLPENLSLLMCGRRVSPLLERMLQSQDARIDGLLLPGNRCALTGTGEWDSLARRHGIPAVVSGYSGNALLDGILHLLEQHLVDGCGVINRYRPVVRPQGDFMAQDRLFRVFDTVEGGWRGVGTVEHSAFRLREAYACCDADRRFPDYRGEIAAESRETPVGCECPAIILGRKTPAECQRFLTGCAPDSPHGACMASLDGTCHLRKRSDRAA